eukprot:scaffold3598_cov115-Cylindrotheca_fusiformis.AAC.20
MQETVKNMKGKRSHTEIDNRNESPCKRSRQNSRLDLLSTAAASSSEADKKRSVKEANALRPYPYFYYKDYSQVPDPDPFKPLTAPGRVPNFPAKMMAILSRPELSDIITWLDHGRAWKVLKPREFEMKVLPTYFEHSKFSSFIRQANGWGFRRLTQGRDRNSYYNELFLRGLPHLCKDMKRCGVSEKLAADPECEPDLYRISREHPVPDHGPDDDSILLPHILKEGPKARMPICFRRSHGNSGTTSNPPKPVSSIPQGIPQSSPSHSQSPLLYPKTGVVPSFPPLHATKEIELGNNIHLNHLMGMRLAANLVGLDASAAASQFAAGFAAATALTQKHYHDIIGSAFGSIPPAGT